MSGRDRPLTDLIIFLIFFVIVNIGQLIRNILDYNDIVRFIGDTIGNNGGVIVASFLFFWLAKESGFWKREIIIFSVSLGLIIYEFIQLLIPWQTFDVNDIFGTLIGAIIASIINLLTVVFGKRNLDF